MSKKRLGPYSLVIMSLHPGTLVVIIGSDIEADSRRDFDSPSRQDGSITISIFL